MGFRGGEEAHFSLHIWRELVQLGSPRFSDPLLRMLAHSLAQSPRAPAGQRFHSLGFQDDLGFQKKALPLHQINSLADSPPAPQQGPPTLHLEPKGILTKKNLSFSPQLEPTILHTARGRLLQ